MTEEEERKQEDYIKDGMAHHAKNIDDFEIDEIVKRSDGSKCKITEKTKNSIEVYIKSKTKKGINCYQWFDMKNFNQSFTKI